MQPGLHRLFRNHEQTQVLSADIVLSGFIVFGEQIVLWVAWKMLRSGFSYGVLFVLCGWKRRAPIGASRVLQTSEYALDNVSWCRWAEGIANIHEFHMTKEKY